ncbi:MAG: hypothetical protein ACC683_04975 [Acidimicrobiia bacterium]
MQALQGTPKRAIHRWAVLLFVAALVATTVTPALAHHDWAAGCSNSNACFLEEGSGGGYMQSDHHDAYTFNDYYQSGIPQPTIGFQTDKVRNRMNSTRAYFRKWANYSGTLFCVNPNSTVWYLTPSYVGSWFGVGDPDGSCRA